jgi:hypothetical protein
LAQAPGVVHEVRCDVRTVHRLSTIAVAGLLAGCASVSAPAAPSPAGDACAQWAAFRWSMGDLALRVNVGVTMEQYFQLVGDAAVLQRRLPKGDCVDVEARDIYGDYVAAAIMWSGCDPTWCDGDKEESARREKWSEAFKTLLLAASPSPSG